ncbi:hypothetical protein [Collinsella aerofaciens]|uniref:hypothetical protein n=1 Tax=Collinsella aerofaciens TaxID=74426 RepID=UPI0034A51F55
MDAKEYFEGIRDEVASLEKSREMLARLKAREGAKAQSYTAGGGGGSCDPMDAINGRIDFEQRLKQRIVESNAVVDEACAVLYGKDNHGGLAKLKGNRYADAVCMGYCQAMPWADVAVVMQCSPKWCRELCNAAFRYIDAVGVAWLKEN